MELARISQDNAVRIAWPDIDIFVKKWYKFTFFEIRVLQLKTAFCSSRIGLQQAVFNKENLLARMVRKKRVSTV